MKRILSFGFLILMVKLPFRSVRAELMIRPVPSISQTVAPISGPMSSLSVPWTDVIVCALAVAVANSISVIMMVFSIFIR